jgi:hypothetical protein
MKRSTRVVPYLSTLSRWRVLIELDESNGARGIVTTVYVRGDFPSEEDARRAGEQAARAWLAGGLLPKSEPLVNPCEELRAAAAAFSASGPPRGLVRTGRRLADAVDRHRASGCKDRLHAAEADRAVGQWRKAEATLAQQSGA